MITTIQDLEPEAAFTLLMGNDSEQIFNFLTDVRQEGFAAIW